MKIFNIPLLLTIAAALPIGSSFKKLEVTRPSPEVVLPDTKDVVQKQSVASMDSAWGSFIRNAKTAKGVLKAELKSHFIEKPKAELQAIWNEATADQSTITIAGEHYDSESDWDSGFGDDSDSESDDDSDEEQPLSSSSTRKSSPAYIKANMRDFSFQPYVRARPPPARSIYDKRSTKRDYEF
ncbi:hypothetical protein FT663_02161 [Candidozyma haemuli var. vulneris]|uniref:Uncharacterized protein n=1 Tax=Candidozyma haemuli TaxID=45357 RepID=A0A2V1ALX1_9ASCO|nr:hypothetical protein CXQ85_001118 [[Candida] haemuloni]KAF3990319.1 hypothetical protein FT662_02312 [[Candida] haemuloni var. vulneris]KAF3992788.1 hypothetical protein FT663_02161 [[Candida] haemuloni var. vulneris]PVH18828.1 hypothetical protein CXQ85_001118 [[Candida] haemuloni]